MTYRLILGDALTVLRTLPANSVQMCCCSPPYFGLRDYGTATWEGGDAACDHKRDIDIAKAVSRSSTLGGGKGNQEEAHANRVEYKDTCGKCGARRIDQQIGLEATPDEFVARLVEVFREVRRVLHPSGQLFVNIGDSRSDSREWLGIPHRLVFALQADGWRWEDEVIWSKPNPMPGSQENRFTRSHEYVFMLNKSRDAFFDGDAVKEPNAGIMPYGDKHNFKMNHESAQGHHGKSSMFAGGSRQEYIERYYTNGRTRRSVWAITTEAYEGSHYATFPTKLVEPMVLAGSSSYGACSKCLAPWERVVERTNGKYSDQNDTSYAPPGQGPHSRQKINPDNRHEWGYYSQAQTTGWAATCTCGADVKPCVVLDPFFGSGTTAAVALKFGRDFIGIDLDARNLELARTRIEQSQPMLFEVQP